MHRSFRVLLAVAMAFALLVEGGAGIGAASEPVPPKDWSGTIKVSSLGFSATQVFFENNACDWAGLESNLNGLDALIWDIQGYEGLPASYSWSAGSDFGAVQTMFVTPECKRMGGVVGGRAEEPGKPVEFLIPPLARWVAIIPIAPLAATDITIEMHSDGTPVEEPKPKKKKKKKRV